MISYCGGVLGPFCFQQIPLSITNAPRCHGMAAQHNLPYSQSLSVELTGGLVWHKAVKEGKTATVRQNYYSYGRTLGRNTWKR